MGDVEGVEAAGAGDDVNATGGRLSREVERKGAGLESREGCCLEG